MNERPKTLTIGALAKAAGVNLETIRFYQRKGLMREPTRPLDGSAAMATRIWRAYASSSPRSGWGSVSTRSRTC